MEGQCPEGPGAGTSRVGLPGATAVLPCTGCPRLLLGPFLGAAKRDTLLLGTRAYGGPRARRMARVRPHREPAVCAREATAAV
jgi:hypothetical protein